MEAEKSGSASLRSRYRLHQLKPIAEWVGDVAALVAVERLVLVRSVAVSLETRAQAGKSRTRNAGCAFFAG